MERAMRMSEYRITFTLIGMGRLLDADDADAYLDGFVTTHPGAGPVTSLHIPTGRLGITIGLEAANESKAFDAARPLFIDGAVESGVPASDIDIIRVEVDKVVDLDEVESDERELAYA